MKFLIRISEILILILYYVLAKVLILIFVTSMFSGVIFTILYPIFVFISIGYLLSRLPENTLKYFK